MDKLKYVKIENEDGSLSDNIPLGVDAGNVDTNNGSTVEIELNNLKNKNNSQDNLINNLNDKINIQDNSINNLQSQVNGLASGSPLVASSIEEMTDTSRIYVNTTDGHWYAYNGTIWIDGGIYQATGIAPNSVSKNNITFKNQGKNKFNKNDYKFLSAYFVNNGNITNSNNNVMIYIPCSPNSYYRVYKPQITDRFAIGTTKTLPQNGVKVYDYVNNNNATSLSLFSNSEAQYLVAWIKATTDIMAIEDIVNNITILKDTINYNEADFYDLDIKNDDLKNVKLPLENTEFYKNTVNEFDYKKCKITNMYLDYTNNVLKISDGNSKMVFFPCNPNTKYSIFRNTILGKHFVVFCIDSEPAENIPFYNRYTVTARLLQITTNENTKYIGIYYYNSNYDIDMSEEQILKEIMIQKGTFIGKFIANKLLDVTFESLDENTQSKINGYDRFTSRSKIYGVKFDLNSNTSKGIRIADAKDFINNYVVNNVFQNAEQNNFDNVFPWCDIRRCNLKIENGLKTITYENEDGFALDGSNGNVMVEIPKFYTMHEIVGNEEILAITGEPKSGFEVEPAFFKDGKEVDFIYVAAYMSAGNALNTNIYSYSSSSPMNNSKLYTDIDNYNAIGYSSYDFAVQMMLQALYTIEFADRDTKAYMQGVANLPYFYNGATGFLIQEFINNHTVIVNNQNRMENLVIGTQIGLGHTENNRNVIRTITDIEDDIENNRRTITFDRDVTGLTALVDSLYGVAQNNGKCDILNYHTGRIYTNNGVSPFRYRYMENLWGNMWHRMAGLKVKELEYYYSFNESDFKKSVDDVTANWKKLNYKAANQHYMGVEKPWIVKCGYDNNNRRIALPTVCGSENGGGNGKYYSAGFFCYYDKNYNDENIDSTVEYVSAMGGSWDAAELSSIYTTRCWIKADADYSDDSNWHYGNRIIYRS